MAYLKCEEWHETYVDCQEERCFGRGADVMLCDKHLDRRIDEARDSMKAEALETAERVIASWEAVVDIDNAMSVVALKKEVAAAINSI